jgi:tRNA-modifying protein YgfZ
MIGEHSSPQHFGDPLAEFNAGRTSAALFDVGDRSQIEVRGADRAEFLHNFCTNDVKRLSAGQGCEAFVTNVKGRVLGHVFLFVEADAIWLESVAGADETLIAHLDRYLITEDVQLHSRTAETGEFFVTGPRAEAVVTSAGFAVDLQEPYSHAQVESDHGGIRVRRVDWFNQPGFLIAIPRSAAAELRVRLANCDDCFAAGSLAFHALRIDAGFPLYGSDISEDNLSQEVGRTARAISFTKGCYLGQEPIARIDAMGHVNRELRRLRLERGPSSEGGARIISPDEDEIGRVTSSVQLTDDSQPLALGYVRSRYAKPGKAVLVESGSELIAATVF